MAIALESAQWPRFVEPSARPSREVTARPYMIALDNIHMRQVVYTRNLRLQILGCHCNVLDPLHLLGRVPLQCQVLLIMGLSANLLIFDATVLSMDDAYRRAQLMNRRFKPKISKSAHFRHFLDHRKANFNGGRSSLSLKGSPKWQKMLLKKAGLLHALSEIESYLVRNGVVSSIC